MNKIPDKFTASDGRAIGFLEVDQLFGDSHYGQVMKKNVRWDRFQQGTSREEWLKLLGADANNYQHLVSQYQIMRVFLRRLADCDIHFKTEDIDTLLLTPIVHDWPEAVVGDLNHEYKTDAHEKKEASILRRQLDELVPHLISAEKGQQLIATTFDKGNELGALFNLTEKIGYFRTAMNSWMRLNQGVEHNGLVALVTNVIGFNLPALVEASAKYPPIDTYVQHHHNRICEVLKRYDSHSFDFYPPHEDRRGPLDRFEKAGQAWEIYKANKKAA